MDMCCDTCAEPQARFEFVSDLLTDGLVPRGDGPAGRARTRTRAHACRVGGHGGGGEGVEAGGGGLGELRVTMLCVTMSWL
jgi:hypothetical protein